MRILLTNRGLKLNHAIATLAGRRRDQFDKCRLGRLLFGARNSVEPFLQPRIVQPQRMSDRIHTVFTGQFHRSLPQCLRELRPMGPGAPNSSNSLVATARSAPEWAMCFCGSILADLGDSLNLATSLRCRHARLPKTHQPMDPRVQATDG